MTTALTIRPAAPADRPALRELFLHARREAFFWLTAGRLRLEDFDMQTEGEDLLVALDGNAHLAGFVSVWTPDRFIHHLFVAPASQRQGVGRALLRALPQWRAQRYRLKCLTRNEAALAFYRAQDFTPIDAGVSEDGAWLLLESP
ncbi:GNAT family N-acetyltransferase [Paraburkholderia bannensis]|uniref:GNAT family N-acetyltransferase n=1 Tax=Paraburkholderia bannensis TaxID=765414 RepID=UPI002AC32BC8|nr:GNAT family N-acetyltransferase [Paraburkholderia bannensis]